MDHMVRCVVFWRQKTITVRIMGGLGNQLFCYFAGLSLANKNMLPLRLDNRLINYGLTNHGSNLQSFDLNGEIKNYCYLPSFIFKFNLRLFDKIYNYINFYRKYLFRIKKFYMSPSIGFDSKVLNLRGPFTIVGYFQSWKYVIEQLENLDGRTLKLKSPSDWYLAMESKIRVEDPIVIHVRRGDLKSILNTSGLLSIDYYHDALINLEIKKQIWVFSDEIDAIRNKLTSLPNLDFVFIECPKDNDPAESMMLMSKASKIIIGNSTFSWWSAILGNKNKVVIAPKPFYRDQDEPQFFIPDNWTRIQSKWENKI